MGLSQVMAGLQTKRTLFAAAAAAAEGGPVAWLVTIETTDGTVVDRLWRGTSPSAALAWTQAQADVRSLRTYRPVTLVELQAIEATGTVAEATDGGAPEAPAAWMLMVETMGGAMVDRLWRGESPSSAMAMVGACPDVRRIWAYRPVTLVELQAMEAAEAAGKEVGPC